MNYKNVTALPSRKTNVAAALLAASVIDERDILSNIAALMVAKSPIRGLFNQGALPGSSTKDTYFLEILKRPLILSSPELGASINPGPGRYPNRYGRLIAAFKQIKDIDRAGINPLTEYMTTLKHSDLFNEKEGSQLGKILPAHIFAFIHEQPSTIIDYPIGAIITNILKSYVITPKVLNVGGSLADDKGDLTQNVESSYGKYKGHVVSAVAFGTTEDGLPDSTSTLKINAAALLNVHFTEDNFDSQLSGSTSGFVNALVATDLLLQMDGITSYLRSLSTGLTAVKPEEKITAIRKALALISTINIQPFLMYAKILYDILMHPVVHKNISRRLPHFYVSELFKDLEVILKDIRLSPLYAEIAHHYSTKNTKTVFGDCELLTIPAGLLHMLPFLSYGMTDKLSKDDLASEGVRSKNEFLNMEALTAGAGLFTSMIDERGASDISEFLTTVRSIYDTYIRNAPENEQNYSSIQNELGYKTVAPWGLIDKADPKVLVTDGLLASERVDYDTFVYSMTICPADLLKSSPHKRLLVPFGKDSIRTLQILTNYYEFKDAFFSASVYNASSKDHPSANMMDTNLVPLMVRRDPWFEKYSVNASIILNGKLPMTRYLLDTDASFVPHSTFANFASDLGMDPMVLVSFLKMKKVEASLVGTEVASILTEFFVKVSDKGKTNIPDAHDYGVEAWSFRFAHYFTSSRAINFHLYSDVVLNTFLNPLQLLQYQDWTRTGIIKAPVARPLFIDKAFASDMSSGSGRTAQCCEDLLSRLSL